MSTSDKSTNVTKWKWRSSTNWSGKLNIISAKIYKSNKNPRPLGNSLLLNLLVRNVTRFRIRYFVNEKYWMIKRAHKCIQMDPMEQEIVEVGRLHEWTNEQDGKSVQNAPNHHDQNGINQENKDKTITENWIEADREWIYCLFTTSWLWISWLTGIWEYGSGGHRQWYRMTEVRWNNHIEGNLFVPYPKLKRPFEPATRRSGSIFFCRIISDNFAYHRTSNTKSDVYG